MEKIKTISKREVARRLTIARKIAGKTQEMAAQILKVSRPTLVSIENGTRAAKIEEIDVLAKFYETTANRILRYEAIHTDLIPRFRKLPETRDNQSFDAATLLNNLLSAEVELENILGIERKFDYPSGMDISKGDVIELADQHAFDLRESLGLGTNPISNIFSILEADLGIRLYQCNLKSDSKVSGLYVFDDVLGACILLNRNHPIPRRTMSAAHELGHFIGNREELEILDDYGQSNSRDERYANRFSRAFLMPKDSFSSSFQSIRGNSGNLNRRIVIELANEFNVSNQACVLRLEELQVVRKGSWNWFVANDGITKEHEEEHLEKTEFERRYADNDRERFLVPYCICIKAHAAWKRELMTEAQLASLLLVDRIELREILDEIEVEGANQNDSFKN